MNSTSVNESCVQMFVQRQTLFIKRIEGNNFFGAHFFFSSGFLLFSFDYVYVHSFSLSLSLTFFFLFGVNF